MVIEKLRTDRVRIRHSFVAGAAFGVVYSFFEYFAKRNTVDYQSYVPLLIRSILGASMIMCTVAVFEILVKDRFIQRRFLDVLLIRTIFYTLIISIWLLVINAVWFWFKGPNSVHQELKGYIGGEMYPINLLSIMVVVIFIVGVGQINNLHRKGELWNFVIGKYHQPREVNQIFCFVDLKGSTAIAEELGHLQFALFLRDYYSDITEALRRTGALTYQYVGDEIILTWPFEEGLKHNNVITCLFMMKQIIEKLKPKYISKFGVYPEFRAGIHGGPVIVTWVGELKKEIVYIGDIVNTTSRIQEDCKRLNKDILISEDVLKHLKDLNGIKATFVEETIPRGKVRSIKLHCLQAV